MLTIKELYTIIGLLLFLLIVFSPFKLKYKAIFSLCSIYLVINYFLPNKIIFDVLMFVSMITPFIIFRFKRKDIYKH